MRRALQLGLTIVLAMVAAPAVASASIPDPHGDMMCTYVVTSANGLNFRKGYGTGFELAYHLNKGERFDAYRDDIVYRDYDWRLVESHLDWYSYGIYAATGDSSGAWMVRDTHYPCYPSD
ncbi:hypothetical protein SAMN05421504_104606 [Amycolatopsis xylanica]|uniref:Peptidase inhibitor family I36 n=1 Tax=Amycolatopsis xylanica TaxID=589385 RepID=A0A1H3HCA0_9PSEU|nr:hypothetical protein [Amycolatopsis xylanica]SDY13077.1 hypothetical protein SAMN05421504_104606 [Amycolatopsis xylanica]